MTNTIFQCTKPPDIAQFFSHSINREYRRLIGKTHWQFDIRASQLIKLKNILLPVFHICEIFAIFVVSAAMFCDSLDLFNSKNI